VISVEEYSDPEEREAWRKTVGILGGLCTMADAMVLDPLILALTDARCRAGEELARVEDRLSRPEISGPEGKELTEREEKRLRGLLRRCDALSTAHTVVLDNEGMYPEAKARTLEVLKEMHEEASEQFRLYKEEVGLRERSEALPA
jgi:hypothetical protein